MAKCGCQRPIGVKLYHAPIWFSLSSLWFSCLPLLLVHSPKHKPHVVWLGMSHIADLFVWSLACLRPDQAHAQAHEVLEFSKKLAFEYLLVLQSIATEGLSTKSFGLILALNAAAACFLMKKVKQNWERDDGDGIIKVEDAVYHLALKSLFPFLISRAT